MPSLDSVDTYIQRSLSLVEASPSSTKISITYGSNLKKHKNDEKLRSRKPITKNFISFKTYEPTTGTCLKYKTYKIKEFSRLLSLLGPKNIQFKKENVRSIGSLMANNEFETTTPESSNVAETVESSGVDTKENTPQPLAPKKKKNKNKKR